MSSIKLVVESDLSQVDNAFTKNQKVINEVNSEVQRFGRTVKQSGNIATKEMREFDEEAKKGVREVSQLSKAAATVGREGAKGVQNLSTQTRKYTADVKQANKETSLLKEQTMSASEAIAAAFSGAALAGFVGKIVNTRAEFQKFEAVLTNTLGSKSLAQNALMMIQEVAAKTPFSVQELTASFVKLANSGFKPTADQITKLGDLAASQGKSFDQLTEGIIDAQTGEFERLKEFGIRASKQGDQVKFTFKGVETQVKNNSTAIQDYILSLGDLQGVAGGMAAISDTLGGKISNLGDNFDAFFNNLGASSEGVFGGVLDSLNEFLGKANEATSILNQMSKTLKGTSGELTFLDNLKGASADLLPLQATLNEVNKIAQKATKASDFVPIYQALGNSIKNLQKEYEAGGISIEQFNRKVILITNQLTAVKEQQKALAADQKAASDRAAAEAAKVSDEEKKRLKEIAEANAKLQKQIEDQKAEAILNDQQREEEKARLDFERKKKEIQTSKASQKLKNEALIQLDLEYYNKKADIENKYNDEREKKAEAEHKKEIDRVNKQADELFDELSKIQDQQAARDLEALNKRIAARKKLEEKYPLTKLFGVNDPAETQKLLDALDKLGDQLFNLLEDEVNRTLEANQKQIDSSKEKQSQLENEKDALFDKLEEEKALKDEGFANDTRRVQEEIARKDAEIAAEKKREAELIEERKKQQKIKLALDAAAQTSNIITAGSTLFAEGAFKGPAGIIAASATIVGMLAAFFALKQQIKAAQEGFAEGGYTGDGGKYQEAGIVHRGEYVITKEKTAKNRALLDGLHTDNPVLIQRGIFDLLKNTGVSLPEKDNISKKRALVNDATYSRNNGVDLSAIQKELSEIKAKFDQVIKGQGNETYNDPNGKLVKKEGNHKIIYRKK